MKISACWIVKNEAKNIVRSIESLREAVDELIVVDTGSTDNTVEIAKSAGAGVDYFEWINDFSAAKNYALSLAKGELIFFPDADEWFEPKLGKEQRRSIEQIFTSKPYYDAAYVNISNINMSTGLLISKWTVIRIFRNKEGLRYRNNIHEKLCKDGSDYVDTFVLEDLNLNHSGYTDEVKSKKTERNTMLSENFIETNPDSPDVFKHYFRLMREYNDAGLYEKSCKYFLKLKEDKLKIRKLIREAPKLAAHYFYMGLELAACLRERFSRRDLYESMVLTMKKLMPTYIGSHNIHLIYYIFFDMKEDIFMKELDISIKAAAKREESRDVLYKNAQIRLLAYATKAAWRRGNKKKAFEYACACFAQHEYYIEYDVLGILLNTLRGQPQADIILFLNSIFNTDEEEKRSWLLKGLQREGYAAVYTYYVKKQLEQGTIAGEAYLLLLILLGRYEEAVKAALSQYGEVRDMIRDSIFLAAVCSEDEAIYRDNRHYLNSCEHILEAFFGGYGLEEINEDDEELLMQHYKTVAFAAGNEKARRFLDVFRINPRLQFLVGGGCCIDNGLFEEVLREDTSFLEEDDFESRELQIHSCFALGRYDEGLNILKSFFESGNWNVSLLHWLLVAAENAEGYVKEKARSLYDLYTALYDELIDLRDVINTKIVFDDSSKKKSKALKNITPKQFEESLNKEEQLVVNKTLQTELSEALLGAAAVYEEKGLYSMALQCYRRLYARSYEPEKVKAGLEEAFERLGNKELAEWFRKGKCL